MPNTTLKELRQHIDSRDPFMSGGHQIMKIRRGWRKKHVPAWAMDDAAIRSFLLKSFPKLASNDRQRKHAATRVRVIHLYFRMGWTVGQVADELGISVEAAKQTVVRVRRSAAGLRARKAGKPHLGVGHRRKGVPTETVYAGSLNAKSQSRDECSGSLV